MDGDERHWRKATRAGRTLLLKAPRVELGRRMVTAAGPAWSAAEVAREWDLSAAPGESAQGVCPVRGCGAPESRGELGRAQRMLEGEPLGGNRRIAEALSRRHRRTAGVTVARSTPVETALRGGPSLLAREHEELTSRSAPRPQLPGRAAAVCLRRSECQLTAYEFSGNARANARVLSAATRG